MKEQMIKRFNLHKELDKLIARESESKTLIGVFMDDLGITAAVWRSWFKCQKIEEFERFRYSKSERYYDKTLLKSNIYTN